MQRKPTAEKVSSKEPRTRITLDLSERSYKRLNDLTELVEADSKASTLRQALQCFEYIAKMSDKGSTFWAIHPDGTKEKVVFFLPSAKEEEPDIALATAN